MPHLLIVDDDDDILSLLTSFFEKHSHTVTVAADGATMFAALERAAADRAENGLGPVIQPHLEVIGLNGRCCRARSFLAVAMARRAEPDEAKTAGPGQYNGNTLAD